MTPFKHSNRNAEDAKLSLIRAAVFAVCLGAGGQALFGEPPSVPAKPGFEVYEPLAQMALFTMPRDETPEEVPVVQAPPFADDLEITSVASIDGLDFVGLRARSADTRWLLAVDELSPTGVKVVSVEWGVDGQPPKVELSKGTEFASLTLSSTLLTASPLQTALTSNNVAPPQPGRPQPPPGVTAPGRPPDAGRQRGQGPPRRRIILPPSQQ